MNAPEGGHVTAQQQPAWVGHPALSRARQELAEAAPIVSWDETVLLQAALARVADHMGHIVQLGDCAESFFASTEEIHRQTALLRRSTEQVAQRTGGPVIGVGRIAGQFAKPRSQLTEQHGNTELPVFRGHAVNMEVATPAGRRADPRRLVWAHQTASRIRQAVRDSAAADGWDRSRNVLGPWMSHEALLLDYEEPQVRPVPGSERSYLSSTHLPWIGDRTSDPAGAHVQLLASVAGPVACKVGPKMSPSELSSVCAALDPEREPGRLILILRLGAGAARDLLPGLIAAMRSGGHRPVWSSDPLHGNTVVESGRKTRHLATVETEVCEVREVLRTLGEHPGGLHLEATASTVTECAGGPVSLDDLRTGRYTTLCDPRLNETQTEALIEGWLNGL